MLTFVACLVAVLLAVPGFQGMADALEFVFGIIFEEERRMHPGKSLAGWKLMEALVLGALRLPFFLLGIGMCKSLVVLLAGRSRISWIGGTSCVVAALYVIPVLLFVWILPEQAFRLAPLGLGLILTAALLFVCGISETRPGAEEEQVG